MAAYTCQSRHNIAHPVNKPWGCGASAVILASAIKIIWRTQAAALQVKAWEAVDVLKQRRQLHPGNDFRRYRHTLCLGTQRNIAVGFRHTPNLR